jgi:hypothetical protein
LTGYVGDAAGARPCARNAPAPLTSQRKTAAVRFEGIAEPAKKPAPSDPTSPAAACRRHESHKPVVKRGSASENHRIHEARQSPNQGRALEGREKTTQEALPQGSYAAPTDPTSPAATCRRHESHKPVVKRGSASENHRNHEPRRSPNQGRALEGREKTALPLSAPQHP